MTRITLRAAHKGELAGIAPTGKTLTISLFTVLRLVDAKIAEE
jgi:predicted ester cyclase